MDQLIQSLVKVGYLKTPRIIEAFKAVDRKFFVPAELQDQAYENIPLPIGHSQTISQPLTVAIMLEALQVQEGERCLDIGAGSGWVTVLLGYLVGTKGLVIGIERIAELQMKAKKNIERFGFKHVSVVVGDASCGWPDHAPYDAIHVAAAADDIPAELKEELAVGGRLIIPIGKFTQELVLITRAADHKFHERRWAGFQFVPLISERVST